MTNNIFEFTLYAEYNIWANEEISRIIAGLPDDQFYKELDGSFRGIQPTLLHIADAQHIWMERLLGNSPEAWPSKDFKGDRFEAIQLFLNSGKRLHKWVLSKEQPFLSTDFSFKTIDGTEYTTPISVTLMHVFNHSTYHRGQLVNFLRALGLTEIPSTDLIRYYRVVKHP